MSQTEDILKNQRSVLSKMLDDRNVVGMDADTIEKEQILLNSQLTPEQLKLAEYVSAILYRLINSSAALPDSKTTLTNIELSNGTTANLSDIITVNLCAIDNAAVCSDLKHDKCSVFFGPRLFLLLKELKKYKQTENKGLYARLEKEKDLTEDDIAAVLAHELGHVLMKINNPTLHYKANEAGADIYGIKLLKNAGYSPTALAKFFGVMELHTEDRQKKQALDESFLSPLVTAIDVHPGDQTRLQIADGYLTLHRQETGESWFAIPTVKIPFNYYKIAETIQPQQQQPQKKEKRTRSFSLGELYGYSYDEILKNLQNDFTPENLNALLSKHYDRDFIHFPSGKRVYYEERIKDILEKCPYQKIYEENPNVDPKLLINARAFIDLISNPDSFMFPANYDYDPVKSATLTVSKGFYYSGKPIHRVESNAIMELDYSDTVRRTFELYTNDMLLDERRYANLSAEEMLTFKKTLRDHHSEKSSFVFNFLDALALKKVLSEPNEGKRLDLLLSMLEQGKCPEEYETQQIYIKETAELLVKKYGTDDGTKAYLEKIEKEVLMPYFTSTSKKVVPNIPAKSILEEFSQKITSKRELSFKIEDIIKSNTEFSLNASLFKMDSAEAAYQTLFKDSADTDAAIEFLTHDFDPSYAYNFKQDNILALLDVDLEKERTTYHSEGVRRDLERNWREEVDLLYQVHTMFWNGDIAVRTAALTRLLDSNKKTSDELFSYSIDKIIPQKVENRQFLIDVVGAFIATYDERERPFLLAALISAQKKTNSSDKFSIGEPLKEFLENIGPAGIKLGQALGSSPSTPKDIREVMQQMKHSAAQPTRWDLYHLYDSCVPKANQKEIAEVLGAGSYYIAVETDDKLLKQGEKGSVYNLLRDHARARAEDTFTQMQRMCAILEAKKQKQYTDFAKIFSGIVEKAANMSGIETDLDVGKIQDTMARQIYHNEDGTGKVLSLGNSGEATLHVANWLSYGESYKETEKVEGIHFNDFPDDNFKHDFSVAYLQLELENIFSGYAFDHDRHGAQMKIKKFDDKHYDVGIFDNGAMAQSAPTLEEQKQFGNVLNNILDELPDVKNPLSVIRYFASGKKGFAEIFNDAVQKESKDGKASDYLLAVQRGMLALNDYMCNLSNGEVLSVIYTTLQKAKETSNSAIVSNITEENMEKLRNLASYLSKNSQEKKEKKSQKKEEEEEEEEKKAPTPIEKLNAVLERIIERRKNCQQAHFTFSPFWNAFAKKMGLSVTARSRLAKITDGPAITRYGRKLLPKSAKIALTFFTSFIFGASPIISCYENLSPLIRLPVMVAAACGIIVSTGLFWSGIGISDLIKKTSATKRKTFRGIFELAEKVKEKVKEMEKTETEKEKTETEKEKTETEKEKTETEKEKTETKTSDMETTLANLKDKETVASVSPVVPPVSKDKETIASVSPVVSPVSKDKDKNNNLKKQNTAAIIAKRNLKRTA